MKEEKNITPINGYSMLFIFFITLFVSITVVILTGSLLFIIPFIISMFIFKGFIMVQPNNSRVLLLFGEYIGTISKMVSIG